MKACVYRIRVLKALTFLGLVFLVIMKGASAQTSPATALNSASVSPELTAFQAEQRALGDEQQKLIARGATPDQIEAWYQKNAARFAAQQQRAQAISASQPAQPTPYITDVDIPEGSSQTMGDFLKAHAELHNLRAQLHNQQLRNGSSVDDVEMEEAFQKQNATALNAQAQRAKTLAEEADRQPLPIPPALIIPEGTSSSMRYFLSLRDQLFREEIRLHNQNLSLSSADHEIARQQWRQQNINRFEQLDTLAQRLTPVGN